MQFIQSAVLLIFTIWAIRNILFWVYLWQLKEYRLDRLRVHLFETIQGRSLFLSGLNIVKWICIALFVVVALNDQFTILYSLLVGILVVTQSALVIKEVFFHTIRRPIWTKKAMLLSLISLIVVIFFLASPLTNIYLWLLFVDKLIPLVIAVFVFFFAFPTEIFQDMKVREAMRKMNEYKNILVIGVSGSYGKTSTKEFISQILSKKFSVVKTPQSNNTTIGVVNTILSKINESTEIFVAEIGAYKKGEVAEIASIIKPSISVTTSISDQHMSLYGSMENVIESEYELIQALPKKNGLALFNGNNKNIQALYDKTKIKKVLYKYDNNKHSNAIPISAHNMVVYAQGISFTAVVHGKEFSCKTNLFGAHVIENILPGIYLADMLGIKIQDIQQAISHLLPPPQTMEKISLSHNILGIDDTFNASPESVFAAIDYLALYKKKKILVLGPLTELGVNAKRRHFEIGKYASNTCDYLFILNKNFCRELQDGITKGKGSCVLRIASPVVAAKEIQDMIKLGDIVLFEGKESKMVMRKLL